MYKTEESEILNQVQPMGLQINKELPVKIYINKK
jgi:hypothetical protein